MDRKLMTFILTIMFVVGLTATAHGQTYTILHNFAATSGDGANPVSNVVMRADGTLYGTTASGGTYDYGTVFKLDTAGNETVLYSFAGGAGDGRNPSGGLAIDPAGNLFGTTSDGGSQALCTEFGCGIVFKVGTSGNETVLHFFTGGTGDGWKPYTRLLMDAAGNLYGTTAYGGTYGLNMPYGGGTVFKIDANGDESVLHSFQGGASDGQRPSRAVIMDAAGNLYGTTNYGGTYDAGTVFKLAPSGALTVLHTFTGGAGDGATPFAGLVMDTAGNLYGTTVYGGADDVGTIFKIDPAGNETLLHSFTGSDGASPGNTLVLDKSGNLYGTSYSGGADGFGTIFKLAATGGLVVLHSFSGPTAGGEDADGATPFADLMIDSVGSLYGTTYFGGSYGAGTVFKLAFAPEVQIANLELTVKDLVASGTLNAGQENSILAKLSTALAQASRGNGTAAIQQMKAFANEVQALINARILTPAEGQTLITGAGSIITALGA